MSLTNLSMHNISISDLEIGSIIKIISVQNDPKSISSLIGKLCMVIKAISSSGDINIQIIDLKNGMFLISSNTYKFSCDIIRNGTVIINK